MINKNMLLAILLLAALFALAGCASQTVEEIAFTGERDVMRAALAYDVGTRTLRGTQTLTARNRTGAALSEAVLRLYMNAQDAQSVTITAIMANGKSEPFALDAEDATVLRIPLAWQPGETVELAWTVMIRHPKADGAALITLPQLAMWENGAWRTEAYDALTEPAYAQAFDYEVELACSSDVGAAFGGALTDCRRGSGETQYTAQMSGARDVSLALLAGGKVRQAREKGVLVTALADSSAAAGGLLARAREALGDLDKAGFAYPFPSLAVAGSSTGREDGVALSGLIALDTGADRETMRRKTVRLTARQTFGVLVENDPWNTPWLSVSLASAAELMSYRARKGQAAYEARYFDEVDVATRLTRPAGVTVGAGTAFFGSDREMMQVLRDQGAAMLLGIEQAAGGEAFARVLALYVQQNAGGIAAQESLEAALLQATGSDWHGYLEDELAW